MSRLAECFTKLKEQDQAAFVGFITAGDPTIDLSAKLLEALPGAGVDIIELGMSFSDPMADGPTIQAASSRALEAGINLQKTLDMVRNFRRKDADTPIVLMGYYNPIYHFGTQNFLQQAHECGVDGLIIVDLPPEEDDECRIPAADYGIDLIRLVTPTTDKSRFKVIGGHASGFLYYVSMAGVTGTKSVDVDSVKEAVTRFKTYGDLPIAVGFGIKTPEDAAQVAKIADGVVVGSAIVKKIEQWFDKEEKDENNLIQDVTNFVKELTSAVHSGRVRADLKNTG